MTNSLPIIAPACAPGALGTGATSGADARRTRGAGRASARQHRTFRDAPNRPLLAPPSPPIARHRRGVPNAAAMSGRKRAAAGARSGRHTEAGRRRSAARRPTVGGRQDAHTLIQWVISQ
ncbi:cytochrome C [Burkholderia pseudomallei]|uniref:cytochrome C n=1 Tax=Burkholderia pseudomallei TaxID=28450 RepID=UPI0021557724|nr:cytochrome C [Burkholderia pseudomallei]